MKNNKKIISTVLLFVGFIFFLSRCINSNNNYLDSRGDAFANPSSCRQCHQAIFDSVLLTNHFKTTATASTQNILGSFTNGNNEFIYDSITKVVMEKKDTNFYQVSYKNNVQQEAHSFDIVFGIKNAQTCLYWDENIAYELPMSYYTAINGWATSPHFPSNEPYFKRLIPKDCFECHSSFVNNLQNVAVPKGSSFQSAEVTEVLDKKSMIFGIDCQRCHGPAATHVNYHIANPQIKTAKFIVTSNSLSQQQKLDICAVCHSGNDKSKLKSRFYFFPGDTLANYFLPDWVSNNSNNTLDVHGNQIGLLLQSKCFLQSKAINCSTCHNPHTNATPNLTTYSNTCIGCHNKTSKTFCTVKNIPTATLTINCIDCHMPKRSSAVINFKTSGSASVSTYILRTHKIAVYKNEIKE